MNKLKLLVVLCLSFALHSGYQWLDAPTDGSDCLVYIPESISPNGDGINDIFFIETACEYKNYKLRIYDFKQRLVFESRNAAQVWDGSDHGIPLPQGYYTWILSFTLEENGDLIREKGKFALVR